MKGDLDITIGAALRIQDIGGRGHCIQLIPDICLGGKKVNHTIQGKPEMCIHPLILGGYPVRLTVTPNIL